MDTDSNTGQRWQARPLQAGVIRAFVFLVPIASSIGLVHVLSRVLPVPTGSFWLYLIWWIGLSGAATVGLVLVDRAARRLLPLAALLKLSLVFPDQAPSRFETALRSGSVDTLKERLRDAKSADLDEAPAVAAQRLLGLVSALDAHDSLTRGHSERVRAYSRLIAEELKLTKEQLDLLNWSALLHDVGKLEIPTEILTKPGRPTDEEWRVLKSHPERGEAIVAPLRDWLGEWTDAVGEHHERWDGGGYPRGKAGDDIALAARIVAVADVFDVITSARSYKSASSTVEARQELSDSAGSQLDPRVVRAFLGVSLGRLRLVMGPLSWLAHAPILGRLPFTPAVSSLSGTLGVVAAASSLGVVAPLPPVQNPLRTEVAGAATTTVLSDVERSVEEDTTITVSLPAVTGAPGLVRLRVIGSPSAGKANVTRGAIAFAPPPNFNGMAVVYYEACWRSKRCRRGVLRLNVTPVNDDPVAVDDTASTQSDRPVLVDVLANDSDPDGDTLVVAAAGRGSAGVTVIVPTGVRWTPPRGFVGRAIFGYTVGDGNGGRALARVVVNVRRAGSPPDSGTTEPPGAPPAPTPTPQPETPPPGGQPPSPGNREPRAADDASTVLEGAAVTIDVLANDSDPDGDTLSLLAAGPTPLGSVSVVGSDVRYVAPGLGGIAAFPYTIGDGKGGRASATVRVTVVAVNSPPSFAGGPDQVVPEGAGAQAVAGWAKSISPGPPDEASQKVAFAVTNDRQALFAAQPEVEPDGTLTYTPAKNANGTATVSVTAVDDGGTANGGVDRSPPQRFTITVTPVNSPPSFVAGPNQVVPEDSGPRTVAGWAKSVSPGPADESGQEVTFSVSTGNPALFSALPTVTPAGTLKFTSAPNANGVSSVTVRAVDDGGTANGGSDTSPPQSFTITITPVNDPPVAADDAVTTSEDSTGVTFDVLANDTDVDLGDAVSLDSYDGSSIANGTLTANGGGSFTYVPDASFIGTETFTYSVRDGDGATDAASVTISVTDAPTAPSAASDAYSTAVDTQLVVPAPGVLANDSDEDGNSLTIATTPVSGPSDGTLVLAADGSFTYTPNSGFTGTDTFTYRIDDGTGLTADGTVTITVSVASTPGLLYLRGSGPTADLWDMTLAPPPAASPVPDYDGDSNPGLTIEKNDGDEAISDTDAWQDWVYNPSTPLVLNGPITLQLWGAIEFFQLGKTGHPFVYLYDCNAGGVSPCTKIAENDVHFADWQGGVSSWVYREMTVGSVTRTINPGRTLRMRLLFKHEDFWLAMTGAYPSALSITIG